MTTPVVLALDASSTTIGYCVRIDGALLTGTVTMRGDISQRLAEAYHAVADLLDEYRPATVAIESPVGRFIKAIIPQARVSGAIMLVVALREAELVEVSPAEGKKALAQTGNADKAAMIAAALARFGRVLDEHQADALGLLLAYEARPVAEPAPSRRRRAA